MTGYGLNANCEIRWGSTSRDSVVFKEVAMSTSPNQQVIEPLRAEYLEMPGLRLTVEAEPSSDAIQARWGMAHHGSSIWPSLPVGSCYVLELMSIAS
jgi:hypothetical protein